MSVTRGGHVGIAVALLAGSLFAAGLALGGMTSPTNVIAFLDVFGDFDPALLFVMIGAIAVHAPVYWLLVRRRPRPLHAERFALPAASRIDRPLVVGAAIFGVGWGLGGFCPGPALTSLATGGRGVAVFVVSMIAGMVIASQLQTRRDRRSLAGAPTLTDQAGSA